MGNEVCGACSFWTADPIDPSNLTAPRQGECRHGPPVPVGAMTQQGLQVIVLRPKVPPLFPACAQFTAAPPDPAPALVTE